MVSQAERERRYKALRDLMRREGYHALLLAGNAEATQRGYVRYVSDWRLWGGNGFAILPLEGEPVLVLGSGSQAYWARGVGWVEDVRSVLDKLNEVINILRSLGLDRGIIGVAGLNRVMAHGDAQRLLDAFPAARVVDATPPVDRVMAIKSAEEIARQTETYEAVARGLARVKEVLVPGKSEREVMAEAIKVLAEQGCLDGIAHISNQAPPYIGPPRERPIERDDIIKVSLEFAGPSGYWIELAGIYSFREAPERERRIFETARQAVQRAAKLMRPGTPAGEISRAIEQTYREAGWEINGRAIWDLHSIGLNVITSPIGLPGSPDLIEENMVINIHPGLLVGEDQWGVYVQDNLLVTPEGGKPLAEYTYEWHVL